MKKILVSLVAMMFLVVLSAHAAPIWGTDASDYLTGERSTSNSTLAGTGNWANGFTIGWSITNSNGLYTYEYTVTLDENILGNPSHLIVELTDGVSLIGSEDDYEIGNFSGTDPSNPSMPSGIYGVKLDYEAYIYSFTSSNAPVWGNFYSKDGDAGGMGTNAIWNTGLNYSDFKTNTELTMSNFIVRPNGAPAPIPEPATLLLFGAGIAGLAMYRRKRS